MISIVQLAFAAALAAPVLDPIPNIDTLKQCKTVAEMRIPGRGAEQCLKNEHEARDALIPIWPQIPRADKSQCVAYAAGKTAPSYVSLLICLEMLKERRGQSAPPEDPLAKPRRK